MILPVQDTPFNCGPACLVAVGRLLGKEFSQQSVAMETDSKPEVGTENETMVAWARKNLPVSSAGTDSFHKGLSIWNIRNLVSGVGHFVVVLGEKDGKIRYFDPYWAKVMEFERREIDFQSGDGKYVRWSINFDTKQNFFDADIEADGEFNPEWALKSLQRKLAKHDVKQRKAEQWKVENAGAIQSSNEWVAKNGLPLGKHQQF